MTSIDAAAAGPVGRREHKRRATRSRLVETAFQLFAAQGFDNTTIAELAEASGVAPRTFYRYFSTKEDVIFAGSEERQELLRAALDSRSPDEPLIDSIRSAMVEIADELVDTRALERLRTALIDASPALAARNLQKIESSADVVADYVATRERCEPGAMWPKLIGRTTTSMMVVARRRWIIHRGADYGTVITEAFRMLDQFVQPAPAALRVVGTPEVTRD